MGIPILFPAANIGPLSEEHRTKRMKLCASLTAILFRHRPCGDLRVTDWQVSRANSDETPPHRTTGRRCSARKLFASSLAGLLSACAALHAQEAPPTVQTNAPWESSVSVGLTITRGNSDTVLFTANALAQRKGPVNEISLGADGTYGENDDVRSAGSAHGFAQYNRLFTEHWYGYARFDALHDAVAEVKYRLSFSPGIGYYFIKNPRTRLSAEFGPGVIHEKVGDETDTYMSLRFAERFEHKFSDTVRIWQSVEFLPQVDRFHNYIINAEAGVETGLSKKLALRVYAQDTYDNEPAEGRKKNDIKLVSAVAYKF